MKKIPTRIALCIRVGLTLCACVAAAAIFWRMFSDVGSDHLLSNAIVTLTLCIAALLIVFRIPTLIHETGHVIFGLCAGLKVRQVCIGWLSFGSNGVKICLSRAQEGETRLSLKEKEGAHAKLIAATLGGPALEILFSAVFFTLYFLFPHNEICIPLAVFGVFALSEAICELLPAEFAVGKTDGMVLSELFHKTGETEISLRLMQAQCIIEKEGIAKVPREILFDVPVVREDSPSFIELLRMRIEYCRATGDDTVAAATRERLESIQND